MPSSNKHVRVRPQARWWRVAQLALICVLPAILFFSYHPVLTLGSLDTMNLELSLPLIWLVIFNLCSIPAYINWLRSRGWRQAGDLRILPALPYKHSRLISLVEAHVSWNLSHNSSSTLSKHRPSTSISPQSNTSSSSKPTSSSRSCLKLIALLAFPLYLTLSCLWSPNPLRGILTVGIFWLILGVVVEVIELVRTLQSDVVWPHWASRLLSRSRQKSRLSGLGYVLGWILIISGLMVSAWCLLQCILDIMGVGREWTLLCEGCTYRSFGFPHPSGFAIEPQFMGGLLLAPALTALYFWQSEQDRRAGVCAFFLSFALFLTFSRGAIYAFFLALLFIIIMIFWQRQLKTSSSIYIKSPTDGKSKSEVSTTTNLTAKKSKTRASATTSFTPEKSKTKAATITSSTSKKPKSKIVTINPTPKDIKTENQSTPSLSPKNTQTKSRTAPSSTSKSRTISSSTSKDQASSSANKLQRFSPWKLILISFSAFLASLCTQGALAALGPTSDNFLTGVTKSIHHLSLGLVDLRPTIIREVPSTLDNYAYVNDNFHSTHAPIKEVSSEHLYNKSHDTSVSTEDISSEYLYSNLNTFAAISAPTPQNALFATQLSATEFRPDDAVFDGYAAVSTDTRVKLTSMAVATWRSSPTYFFFGTGLGGAGTVLYQHYPELGSAKEIVQNEYASLLLETGIMGYITLLISACILWINLRRRSKHSALHAKSAPSYKDSSPGTRTVSSRQPILRTFHITQPPLSVVYLLALILAYAATLCFFSGLPNALYIYLLPPIAIILIKRKTHETF